MKYRKLYREVYAQYIWHGTEYAREMARNIAFHGTQF